MPEDGRRPPAGKAAARRIPLPCKDQDDCRPASVTAAGLLAVSPVAALGPGLSIDLAVRMAVHNPAPYPTPVGPAVHCRPGPPTGRHADRTVGAPLLPR